MATDKRPESRRLGVMTVGNAEYIEEMYSRWQTEPSALSAEWQAFFSGFDLAMCPRDCVAAERARAQSQVASLIFAYRALGHLIAQVDPLGNNPTSHPTLQLERFGLTRENLDQVFDTGHLHGPARARLSEIIEILHDTYCRSIGVEYIHIQDREVRRWLQAQMEPTRNKRQLSAEQQKEILHHLIDAEVFETFIHSRYPAQKRFSLEGAESLIPALHHFVELATHLGADEVVMGMSHRGRLNVLANILDKPYPVIFNEFEDNLLPEWAGGDGDVKYHRGFSSDHESHTEGGRMLHISLTANPSHLEAVDPVVEGRARAKQRRRDDQEHRSRVIPLLVHGDAAFAGQGLVAETLNLSQLEGYRTGGTVHFIINNQIGFTTLPAEARSSLYSTDVAKMVEAPIFHVNGDDPEAVVWAIELALRFRQQFGRDVVVDMICYRRHGHNEGDEPAFTQPVLYAKIKDRPSVRVLYTDRLLRCCDLSEQEGDTIADEFKNRLQAAFEEVKDTGSLPPELRTDRYAYDGIWKGLDNPYSHDPTATGVAHELLAATARALTSVPEGFELNPKVARQLPKRREAVEGHGEVDWSLAELLAFGTLLVEGNPVRLSGQDSARGTFSQRHSVWHDMNDQTVSHVPLNHIDATQEKFCVYNSMLSEAAVLGFDYGYSLAEPHMLVLWEAQFGDFANGAQVIIDQFIVGSLAKWQRSSGLVMLLPHGYEGQGPDHSNAYLERYLAACAEHNIQVCNLTTPAQYFHVLRRQLRRPFRRPLVIMSPKSLLRHKLAVSPVDELVSGRFQEVLDDPMPPQRARRLVLCSGKVFYDVMEARAALGVDDVAVVRLEQLYPLHRELLQRTAKPYLGADEIVWLQEEPQNRGAWSFMLPRLLELFPDHRLRYAGRPASASPATGSHRVHEQEQDALVHEALTGTPATIHAAR